MVQVVGTEASVLSVVRPWGCAGLGVLLLAGDLLCLVVGLGSEVNEWRGGARELAAGPIGGLAGIWVDNVVLVLHLSGKEIKEGRLLVSASLSLDTLSHGGLLLLVLSHLEEGVQQAERGDDEDDEEVHDLEGDVALLLKVVPLVLDVGDQGLVAQVR